MEAVAATALLLAVVGAGRLHSRCVAAAGIGVTVAALICLAGSLKMTCFNLARDLGPRLFSALAEWGTWAFEANGTGWLTVYILALFTGGLVGGGLWSVRQ